MRAQRTHDEFLVAFGQIHFETTPMDEISPSRNVELQLLALRTLLPRILASVLADSHEASDLILNDDAILNDVASFAQTDEETSFIVNYEGGLLSDARELL